MNVSTTMMQFAVVAGSAFVLSACSGGSAPRLDAGERMSARGAAISGRGSAWNEGQNDVQAGQKALGRSVDRAADGEKDLRQARDAVVKAERKIQDAQSGRVAAEQRIASGQAKMQQAETDYRAIRSQPSVLPPLQ